MPATFAHPAAVLPFLRFGHPAAFIIGAMVPDAAYFLPGESPRLCHQFYAIFWFGIPAGLIGWFGFQHLLRPTLFELAPDFIRQRTHQLRTPPFSAATLLCLLVGTATHVAWDAATHAPGISRLWQHLSTQAGSIFPSSRASPPSAWWPAQSPAISCVQTTESACLGYRATSYKA